MLGSAVGGLGAQDDAGGLGVEGVSRCEQAGQAQEHEGAQAIGLAQQVLLAGLVGHIRHIGDDVVCRVDALVVI